ncbi:MAG: DUF1353 domain-containing protein [Candidatus Gastranaerophilales bacterium]|nr:DUF1353 domain-containing protein [Candidatus Gastranaerophilales bacterium]
MSICWYDDEEILIEFGDKPNLNIRYISPFMSESEIKEINKKPFVNNQELFVLLQDKILVEEYNFTIPNGYIWDGATIPRVFWRLIGPKTDQRFLIPSLIHDVLCENKDYINNDRYFSTIVFERLLYVSKVNPFSRWMIKHSVDNFQKFCGW